MITMVKRVLGLSGTHKKRIILGIIFNVLKAFCMAFMFISVFYIFDHIENLTTDVIWKGFAILVIGVIGRFIFQWLVDIFISAAGYEIFKDFRLKIGDKLKRAPMGYFSEQNLGTIQGVLTTTVSSLESYAMLAITDLTGGVAMAIFMISILFIYCMPIGILSLIGLFVGALVLKLVNVRAQKSVGKMQEAQENLVTKTFEFVRGIGVLRIFKKGADGQKEVISAFEQKRKADLNQEKNMAGTLKAYSMVFKMTSCLMILLAVYLYLNGILIRTYAISFIISAFFVYSELELIGNGAFLSKQINIQLDRLEQVTNIPMIDKSSDEMNISHYNIGVKDVSFAYDENPIIKNVTVEIPEKATTAIVGYSGSGKTTLCNLIARFWDVQEGHIYIGGKDITKYSYDSLMKNISMVFQDVYLFNDTVENNIRFGRQDASLEEIREAAKKASCDEFIMKLPCGYRTMIGEGGSTLSGGEKQRISIARAILKDAPIIILDEATSSVDPENEYELLTAIEELTRNKTLITIAHRMSTVTHADQIIVMDNGSIAQIGTHKELSKQKGIYKKFLEIRQMSSGWEIEKEQSQYDEKTFSENRNWLRISYSD